MYRLEIRKNKDFREKKCCACEQLFKPENVVVVVEKLEKKGNELYGFVCQGCIKSVNSWELDYEPTLGLLLRWSEYIVSEKISEKGQFINNLIEVIKRLKVEIKILEEREIEKGKFCEEIEKNGLLLPTWRAYKKARNGEKS